jgi:hypothetical protein
VGDAEVRELGEPGARGGLGEDHDVLRLHVAVDHAAVVGVIECVGQRNPNPGDVAVGEGARLGELGKGSAPNQLRDQIGRVLVMVELVQPHHPGMVEPGGRAGLALRARDAGAAVVARDHLHRDVALEPFVVRQPDHAEAPRAQHPLEAVSVQDEPGLRWHPQRFVARGQLLGRCRSFHAKLGVRARHALPCRRMPGSPSKKAYLRLRVLPRRPR